MYDFFNISCFIALNLFHATVSFEHLAHMYFRTGVIGGDALRSSLSLRLTQYCTVVAFLLTTFVFFLEYLLFQDQ